MKQLTCVRIGASNSKVGKENVITQANVDDTLPSPKLAPSWG